MIHNFKICHRLGIETAPQAHKPLIFLLFLIILSRFVLFLVAQPDKVTAIGLIHYLFKARAALFLAHAYGRSAQSARWQLIGNMCC